MHRTKTFTTSVREAKLLQEEGVWIENPNIEKHPERHEPKLIFSATYSVLWRPEAFHKLPPFTDDDTCEITQIGNWDETHS